jgi:release factor glutamine methyltransferase
MTLLSDAQSVRPTVSSALTGTLRSAIVDAARNLADHGVASPRHDAEMIAAHLLRVPRTQLWRHLDDEVPPGFTDLIGRRAARVPLQHITGTAYFRHATLHVGPGVFIPRPETEIVVDEALRLLHAMQRPRPVVVDLCAGSGAIALSLATEFEGATVHAVELDPGARPWLRENVTRAGVHVHSADMEGSLPELDGTVDLVISNPPYIPSDAVPRELEVARYDPELALYSGADGLDHIRVVERTASRLLRPSGWVVVEHADQQGTSAPAVFDAPGWTSVRDHRDLTGRDRFLTAQRSAGPDGH